MSFRSWFKPRWRRARHTAPATHLASARRMRATLTMVAQTQAQEPGCDDAYAFLDTYAEQVSRGEDAAALLPLVHHHLALCPDCREELDVLLRAITATTA